MTFHRGMTLIEMIVAIVILGIAMLSFTSFLVPQISDSASAHYQTRAVALGQSFMSQILARDFDQNSDPNGGEVRCGEGDVGSQQEQCTLPSQLGADGETQLRDFNDVDDFIGCWYTETTQSQCSVGPLWPLQSVLGDDVQESYRNFRVEIDVVYDGALDSDGVGHLKRINMTIFAGQSGRFVLTAYKGNF
ncbi:MSHA pilin protein MshD [Vibrio crassostreae]|nr:MSHA pilin protein MshD [Vibrio crassostreae]CAK3116163.1 MSHA pilin protein MshD [Vibrio crassostreae]